LTDQEEARSRLGARLRELRLRAGLTGAQLSAQTGWSQPKISRIETSKTMPTLEDLGTWARLTGATAEEADELVTLAIQAATSATSWRILHQLGLAQTQQQYGELELAARTIRIFQPVCIPGLLQTAEYARRVMLSGNPSAQTDIAEAVAKRMQRQAILYDQAKQFEFIMTEAAVRWRPGPVELMRAQFDHLASIATLPNVALGTIPLDIESSATYRHAFVVLEGEETVITVETFAAELQIRDPADIATYHQYLDRLRQMTVWADEAVAYLRSLQAGR